MRKNRTEIAVALVNTGDVDFAHFGATKIALGGETKIVCVKRAFEEKRLEFYIPDILKALGESCFIFVSNSTLHLSP